VRASPGNQDRVFVALVGVAMPLANVATWVAVRLPRVVTRSGGAHRHGVTVLAVAVLLNAAVICAVARWRGLGPKHAAAGLVLDVALSLLLLVATVLIWIIVASANHGFS
jgi:uncharacterized membrane protein